MSVSDKLNEITKAKRSQQRKAIIAETSRHDFTKANRLFFCGSWLYFREWLEHEEAKVINAQLCKLSFLCQVCAIRRQAKLYAASVPKVKLVHDQNPNLKMAMVTLTTKTGSDLGERMDHLRRSFSKMLAEVRRVKSLKSFNGKNLEMGKAVGMLRSFEIKRSKGDSTNWNCHLHAFAFLDDWINVSKLSDEWNHFTGDSIIVHVEEVKPKDDESEPIESALAEVIKYPLKFADLLPEDAWHAHDTLHGARMTDTTGLLRGIRTGSLEIDSGIEEMTGPYRDFVASWSTRSEKYRISQVDDQFGGNLKDNH